MKTHNKILRPNLGSVGAGAGGGTFVCEIVRKRNDMNINSHRKLYPEHDFPFLRDIIEIYASCKPEKPQNVTITINTPKKTIKLIVIHINLNITLIKSS